MKLQLTSLVFVLFASVSAHTATIAQWTFETNPPADVPDKTEGPTIQADVGSGVASGLHASAATDWTTPAGNASGNSFSGNNWNIGDYWQFKVSASDHEDIIVSWDQTRSSSGPAFFDFSYSIDGVNYFVVSDGFEVAAVTWSTGGSRNPASLFTVSLSGKIPTVDDMSDVYFRIVADSAGSAPGGTGRIDNFTVSGTAIERTSVSTPDAGSSFLLLSLALAGVAGAYRR